MSTSLHALSGTFALGTAPGRDSVVADRECESRGALLEGSKAKAEGTAGTQAVGSIPARCCSLYLIYCRDPGRTPSFSRAALISSMLHSSRGRGFLQAALLLLPLKVPKVLRGQALVPLVAVEALLTLGPGSCLL